MAPESNTPNANAPIRQTVAVPKPDAGANVTVNSSAGGQLQLNFDPSVATPSRSGNDLSFDVEGGGKVTVRDFFAVGDESLPSLRLPDGTVVASTDFFSGSGLDMTTAAGPGGGGAAGGGSGEYADDAGNLLAGVDRLGSLGTDFWARDTEVPEIMVGSVVAGGTFGFSVDTAAGGDFAAIIGVYEDGHPLQHTGDFDTLAAGKITLTPEPDPGSDVGDITISDLPADASLYLGDPAQGGIKLVPVNGVYTLTLDNFTNPAAGVFILPGDNNSDVDFPINVSVEFINGTSSTTSSGAFLVAVDAVADMPGAGPYGSGGYMAHADLDVDRQKFAEWKTHTHGEGATIHTGELDDVTINVRVTFTDYADGSEFHTIEVKGIPSAWTLNPGAEGGLGGYASVGDFSDIDAARLALHGASDSYATVTVDGVTTYIFNVSGVAEVNSELSFNPHDWTSARDANGNPHLGEGEAPVRLPVDIEVTARAEEVNTSGYELNPDNNVAEKPLGEWQVVIKEDTPDFAGCRVSILSDETKGVQWGTDEISLKKFYHDVSLQKILSGIEDLPDGKPVSVAREGIAYNLHSDGVNDAGGDAGKAFLGFKDYSGADSGWQTSANEAIFLFSTEEGVLVGRVGHFNADTNAWEADVHGRVAFVVAAEDSDGVLHSGLNTGSLTFVQYEPLEHPRAGDPGWKHNEKLSDPLDLKLTLIDDDGDKSTLDVVINVRDDGPSACVPAAGAVWEGMFRVFDELHASGHISVDFGADDQAGKDVYWDREAIAQELLQEDLHATVGPEGTKTPLEILNDPTETNPHVITIGYQGENGPVVVMKLELVQDALGHYKYEYTQYDTVAHGDKGIADVLEALRFRYVVRDSDGDTAGNVVAIHIKDASVLPSLDGAHVDESYDMHKVHTFDLDHIDYNAPDGIAGVAWNKALVIKALSEYHATNSDEALEVAVSQDGTVLRVYDGDSDTLVFTATLTGNATDGFQVEYYQSHALSHLIPGLAHDDPLPLLLTFDVIDGDADKAPNLFAITVDDDGPESLFAANVLMLQHVGQTMLEGLNDISLQNPEAFVQSLTTVMGQVVQSSLDIINNPGVMTNLLDLADLVLNTNLARFGDSAEDLIALIQVLQSGDITKIGDIDNVWGLLNTLIQGVPGYESISFVENPDPTQIGVNGLKAALLAADFAGNPLKFLGNDSDRTEGHGPYKGTITPDFGVDGAAGSTSQITGWEQSPHADKIPNGVGWSPVGVQGMLHLLGVHATAHPGAMLMVEAVGDKFPPSTLQVTANGDLVMTLTITDNGGGTYGYSIDQSMALAHDPSLVANLLGGLADAALQGNLPAEMQSMLDTLEALGIQMSPSSLIQALTSGNLLTLPLPIVIMDGDGDIAPSMISLTIRDSVPARIDGATLILSETDAHHSGPGHYEVIGTDAARIEDNVGKDGVTDEHTVSGKFTFTEASYGYDGANAETPFFWETPEAGKYQTWGAAGSDEPVDIRWVVSNKAGEATLTGIDARGCVVIRFVAEYEPGGTIPIGYKVVQYLPVVHADDAGHNDVNIPVTFGIMDGDGDTATATLNVTIRDDVPLAISETDTLDVTNTGTEGAPVYEWTATGNIIDETGTDMAGKGGDQWGADGRRPADGLKVWQPDYSTQDPDDGEWKPIPMNSHGETEINGVYGSLFMQADGSYRYKLDPAKLAEAEKNDPHYGKAYVPPSVTDLGGEDAALNLKGTAVNPVNPGGGITFKGFSVSAGSLPDSVPVDGTLWTGASAKNAVGTANGIGVAGSPSGNDIGQLEGLFINLHGTASGEVTLTLTNLGPTFLGGERATVAWYDVSGDLIANSTTELTGDSGNLATVTGPSGASYAVVLGLTATGYITSTSFTVSAIDGDIARDGHWVDDPNWTPKENFDYTLTDRDGDTDRATLTIDLKTGPTKLGAPANLYVAEADLTKGTDYIPGGEHAHGTDNRNDGVATDHEEFSSGSVSFLSPEGIGSVQFKGAGAAVTVTFDADGKGSWTGDIQTQYGKVIAVTLVEYADTPGKYSLEYTYQLTNNQPNTTADDGSVKQTGADGFSITIQDKYGSGASDAITFDVKVDIQDDVPFIEAVSGADGVDGGPAGTSWQGHTLGDDIVSGLFSGETRDGSIDMTGGADGVASLKVSYLDGDDVKHEFTLAATSVSEARAQVLDTDYGTLKVWYDGTTPKYRFFADNATGEDGAPTFTFTVTDKDGDTAFDTLTFEVAPLTLEFESLSVDESWLNAGGIQGSGYKDMDTPDDATPGVASALKTLGLTQAQYEALTIHGSLTEGGPAGDIDISANMPASGGLDIYSDHGYLTVRYDGDTDQLSYSFTLTKNFDKHPDNPTNWDEAQEAADHFDFAVGSTEGTLNITIYDDGLRLVDNPPAMVPIDYAPESYNIVLCLDISGSMLYDRSKSLGGSAEYWPQTKTAMSGIGTDHGESYYEKTELFAMQVSILEMLEAYAARGAALNIGIVGFYGTAQDISDGTLDATDAAKIVSSLLPGYTVSKNTVTGEWEATYDNSAGHLGTASWLGGSTSYTAGLDAMLTKYGTLLNDPGEEVRAYFFSDGYPNTNNGDSFYENWQDYLATQATNAHFQLHTVGIDGLKRGDYFDGVNLNEAAGKHHEIPASDLTAFIKELAGTVGVYQGFLELPHTADGVIHVDANGDGKVDTGEMRGFVQKVTLNGTDDEDDKDYELVPVNGNGFPNPTDGVVGGESVKITTEYGSFTFYANGKYTFVPTDEAGKLLDDTDFAFTITFMDADGDTVAQDFSFTIQASKHFIDATADHGAVVIDEVAVHYPIGSEKAPIYVHDDIVGKENIHSNSFDPYVVIYGGGKGGSKGEISQDAAMGALSEDGFFNSFFPATIGTLTEIRKLAEDITSVGNGALTPLSSLVLALDLSDIPSGQWITAMQTAAQTAADAGKVLYVYSSTQGHEALSLTFSSLTLSGSDGKPAAVIFDGSLSNTNSLTVTGFLYIAEDFSKQGSASITGAIAVGDDFIPTAGGNISGNTVAGSIVEFQSVMQDLSVTYQNLLANDVYETMSGSVALAAGLITLDFPQFDQNNEFVDPNGFYTVTHDPANGVLTIHSVDGQYHGPLVLDYTIADQAGNSDTSHLVIATPEDKAALVQVGTVAADTLTGAVGNDILIGERGDDVIHGMAGNDAIYGDEGNDLVYGGKGDDIIHGGAGNDIIHGGAGADVMYGGSGSDTFLWLAEDFGKAGSPVNDTIHDFNLAHDSIRFDDVFGPAGFLDTLLGSADADVVSKTVAFTHDDTTFEAKFMSDSELMLTLKDADNNVVQTIDVKADANTHFYDSSSPDSLTEDVMRQILQQMIKDNN